VVVTIAELEARLSEEIERANRVERERDIEREKVKLLEAQVAALRVAVEQVQEGLRALRAALEHAPRSTR
jgi:chromosome segregation ATPase